MLIVVSSHHVEAIVMNIGVGFCVREGITCNVGLGGQHAPWTGYGWWLRARSPPRAHAILIILSEYSQFSEVVLWQIWSERLERSMAYAVWWCPCKGGSLYRGGGKDSCGWIELVWWRRGELQGAKICWVETHQLYSRAAQGLGGCLTCALSCRSQKGDQSKELIVTIL